MSDSEEVRPHVPYRIRQRAGPWIDRLTRSLGQPSFRVRRTEYAGTVDCSRQDLEARLQKDGFSWAPFSPYHRTSTGTRSDGSWVYRSSLLSHRQIHVILFDQPNDTVDVYAHTEYNQVRHPIKHLRQVGVDRAEGAAQIRRWLAARGPRYNHESRLTQKATHLLERAYQRYSSGGTVGDVSIVY